MLAQTRGLLVSGLPYREAVIVDLGTDLSLDFLWFLGPYTYRSLGGPLPDFYLSQQEKLRNDLPLAASYCVGKTTDLIAAWQKEVRQLMTSIGFYTGKLKIRPDGKLTADLKMEVDLFLKEPVGSEARIYVYSLVKKKCAALPAQDPLRATIAYANEARARAKKFGGIELALDPEQDLLLDFWAKLRKVIGMKSRLGPAKINVRSLEFFDHGLVDQQNVGMDVLREYPDICPIPRDLAYRFRSGAEIWLWGCLAGAGADQAPWPLGDHLAGNLLLRGGKVFGFKDLVELRRNDCAGVAQLPDRREKAYARVDGRNEVEGIIRVMRDWASRGFKVSTEEKSSVEQQDKSDAEIVEGFATYPEDYPD